MTISPDINEREHRKFREVDGEPVVAVTNPDGSPISYLTEDTLLLRRIVKLLESNAVVDINNRQKITLDSVTNGAGGTGYAVTGLSSGAGVPSPNYPTANAPVQQPGGASWQPVWVGPVDQRFQIIDAARLTYDQGIRSHLTFT